MWDSTLLAYQDRSRVIPPDYRRLVIRQNGDVLPTLLVDGYVAGVWRPVGGGIEATAFHPLPEEAWVGLASEAGALVAFLAGLGAIFFSIPALSLTVSAVVVLLMSGMILYETSNIIRGGETNYVMATLSLFVSIFNLFASLLHLLGFASND